MSIAPFDKGMEGSWLIPLLECVSVDINKSSEYQLPPNPDPVMWMSSCICTEFSGLRMGCGSSCRTAASGRSYSVHVLPWGLGDPGSVPPLPQVLV